LEVARGRCELRNVCAIAQVEGDYST
jgi:hypothetical protein